MEAITTTVPIPTDVLKKVLTSSVHEVVVDVANSTLPYQGILTYLTNLDLEVTLYFETVQSYFGLIKTYMRSPMLHDFPVLEQGALSVLLQSKSIPPTTGLDYQEVIDDEDFRPVLARWMNLMESLGLYAVKYLTDENEAETFLANYPSTDDRDLTGINFIKLISHPDYPLLIDNDPMTPLQYHTHFFDRQVFRGSTLEQYWRQPTNALFVIAQGKREGVFDSAVFEEKRQADIKALGESDVPVV